MNIDVYERLWMWAAAVIIAIFVAVIGLSTVAYGLHPPSHIETIDPAKIFTDPRFSKIGQPVEMPDGTLEVQMAALMFAYAEPDPTAGWHAHFSRSELCGGAAFAGHRLAMRRTAWASFWIAALGTLAAVVVILAGKATVLYTFYPPLKAHPAFYIGLTLVVVGSWGWALVMLRALRVWCRPHGSCSTPSTRC